MDGQLEALPTAHPFVQRILKRNRLVHNGDGAFSRVYAVNKTTVLKVTTCEVTIKSYKTLIRTPIAGHVKVYKSFGIVAESELGPCYGYLIERLYSQKEFDSLRNVRDAAKKRKRVSKFSEDDGTRRRVSNERAQRGGMVKTRLKKRRLRERLTLEKILSRIKRPIKKHLDADGRNKGSDFVFNVGRVLNLNLPGTLALLSRYNKQHWNGEFDLLVEGNILLDYDGEPCLADPLTKMERNTMAPPAQMVLGDYLSDQVTRITGHLDELEQLDQMLAALRPKKKVKPVV